ncbi:cytochrome P450 89A2-like [Phoenix dactylifera]|uniref:Cytochrome P450 89A2-like n=1 Tax=Phoenix dactylifera TaxID=42345 RepID=A0A8B8ZBN5_PHODC|nr:cytochrome P450 89A2-like [Phoenix dactylifera]
MDIWLLIQLSLSLATALTLLLRQATTNGTKKRRLPPGPPALRILGNIFWLWRSFQELEFIIRERHSRYEPIVTLRIGSRPAIFISENPRSPGSHRAGRHLLRPPRPPPRLPFPQQQPAYIISAAAYGPFWRLLRRNQLISEILHSSRVKLHAPGRAWVLRVLTNHLRSQADSNGAGAVTAMRSFHVAMFCLLVLMCLGEKLDEKAIEDIEIANRSFLPYSSKLNVLGFFPRITRYILGFIWNRIKTASQMCRRQAELFLPLIEARKEHKKQQQHKREGERYVHSYVDSLLDMEFPEEWGRKLTDEEIVSLCSEFLNAGTDSTSTALQWIMANLVKHQDIQGKLVGRDRRVVEKDREEIKEEDLQRMPYLKAVIMEGLRRHPPAHFVLPRTATEDATLDGHLIPKNASVNFMVAEMSWDGKVWEEPMEFKPEKFLAGGLGEGVDITGSREIKMMPFGASRRTCPGLGLAMLHLEYFVANLVRAFEWKAVDGEEVDLSEKTEFMVVMKKPLRREASQCTSCPIPFFHDHLRGSSEISYGRGIVAFI